MFEDCWSGWSAELMESKLQFHKSLKIKNGHLAHMLILHRLYWIPDLCVLEGESWHCSESDSPNKHLWSKKSSYMQARLEEVHVTNTFISFSQELAAVRDALTPSLACVAAKNGDLTALKVLQDLVTASYFISFYMTLGFWNNFCSPVNLNGVFPRGYYMVSRIWI